jgi:bis(5'-adenosyl)-triphosphatase
MAAQDYTFGPYKIHHTEVFYSTDLSYAMVNLRPLLPGNNQPPSLLILLIKLLFFAVYSLILLIYSNKIN